MILDESYIDQLKEYLESGELGQVFDDSSEERRFEILDFLEKVIELGEVADKTATEVIFKNSQLGSFFGEKNQK
jgi:hypothetical protein